MGENFLPKVSWLQLKAPYFKGDNGVRFGPFCCDTVRVDQKIDPRQD